MLMAALALPAQAPSCGFCCVISYSETRFWAQLNVLACHSSSWLIVPAGNASWGRAVCHQVALRIRVTDLRDGLWSAGIALVVVKSTGRQALVRLVLAWNRRESIGFNMSVCPYAPSALQRWKGRRRGVWRREAMSSHEKTEIAPQK